jgi:hypothetical protein
MSIDHVEIDAYSQGINTGMGFARGDVNIKKAHSYHERWA